MSDGTYVPPPNPGRFVVQSMLALRAAVLKVLDAITPPELTVFEHTLAVMRTQMVHVAAKLKIADILENGPLDAPELALRTGANPDALERMMRALVQIGVFRRERDGRFGNNRVSRVLRRDALGGPAFPEYFGAAYHAHAWAELEHTVMTGKSAFERVHGTSFWGYFEKHPEHGATFNEAMSRLTELDAPGVAALPVFRDVKKLCDVAGGSGMLLAGILDKHPHLSGMLFDQPARLEEARARLRQRNVLSRCEFVSGDFFEAIPAGADAYLLKDILHDWDDAHSLSILRNCRRAMNPNQRILIVELLVTDQPVYPMVHFLDMEMMTVLSQGRQRTEAQLRELLDGAGFDLRTVHPLPGLSTLLEGIAR
ncbi:acetylserotonin O-methyltransferase [Pendulispora rubella]|uniref:Acetylserotonin O-methyltransferase n=1 Tax=Pendulispora rubella TaxID=2741070 RepID=A0ABZ2LKT0_9BACT